MRTAAPRSGIGSLARTLPAGGARRRVQHLVGLCATALLFTVSASAETDAGRPRYSDADWALLPEWCIDTQDGPFGGPNYSRDSPHGRSRSPRSDRWTAIFGRDFWHLHHFCRALHAERQATMAVSPQERTVALGKAINDFRYVIETCTQAMPLMPEVYYRLGALYLRTGQRALAGEAFAAARTLKPDYWPAYTRWVDELISLRLLENARSLLEEGLRQAPEQAQLLERRRRLDALKPSKAQAARGTD